MNDYEKLAEFISRINEQMSLRQEEDKALKDTYDKLMATFKSKTGVVLDSWEKEIEEGNITDPNTIQGIKGLRERYNTMFPDNNKE